MEVEVEVEVKVEVDVDMVMAVAARVVAAAENERAGQKQDMVLLQGEGFEDDAVAGKPWQVCSTTRAVLLLGSGADVAAGGGKEVCGEMAGVCTVHAVACLHY